MRHFERFRPVGLRRYLRMSLQLSRSKLQCQYRVHELIPTQRQISKSSPSFEEWNPPSQDDFEIHPNELAGNQISSKIIHDEGKTYNQWDLFTDENGVKCVACELYHKVPSFGFVFVEPSVSGLLDKRKLAEKGLLKSPLCGKLAKGISVELNGEAINPADVKREDEPGRKVSILGDCHDSTVAVGPCRNSDLILHESTLQNDLMETAISHGHSTPQMAVDFANACNARHLVLNHFSQRYRSANDPAYDKDDAITDQILLEEGRRRAQELNKPETFVDIACDLKVFNIFRPKLL